MEKNKKVGYYYKYYCYDNYIGCLNNLYFNKMENKSYNRLI